MSSELNTFASNYQSTLRRDSVNLISINEQTFEGKEGDTTHSFHPNYMDLTNTQNIGDVARNEETCPSRCESLQMSPARSAYHNVLMNHPSWTEVKEGILIGPYDYLAKQPGKDFRSQFITVINIWLRVPRTSLGVITSVMKMLHTASLLIDDIEDSSVLRRGLPVAHNVFGVAQTINSANYVYFKASSELMSLDNPELIRIFTSELLELHRGQGLDLYWRASITCPSEDEYLDMIDQKTGGLFRMAVKLMQAESTTTLDCSVLVITIGQLFQIFDDYLNLSPTSEYDALKGYCEDLTEGKFSFPTIHAIHADPTNQILPAILRLRTIDKEIKRYALGYMESKGSFQYCREAILELRSRVETLIDDLDSQMEHSVVGKQGTAAMKRLLERLVIR